MKWISVHEKVPDDLEEVLFTDNKEIFKGYRMRSSLDDRFSWYSNSDFTIHDVTHWMYLPELPK